MSRTKGQLDHLQNISLKRTVDETFKAEDTLKGYNQNHLQSKNERFINSANSIFWVLRVSPLFAADVSYRKSYYESFRSPWRKRKIDNSNATKDIFHNNNRFYEIFSSVQFHIVDKYEIHTLA